MDILIAYILKFLVWGGSTFVGAYLIRKAMLNFRTGMYFYFGLDVMLVISAAACVAKMILVL